MVHEGVQRVCKTGGQASRGHFPMHDPAESPTQQNCASPGQIGKHESGTQSSISASSQPPAQRGKL